MKKKQKSKKNRIDEKEFWVNSQSFRYRHPILINSIKTLCLAIVIGLIVYVAVCAKTILSYDELKIAKEDLMIRFENSNVYDIDGNLIATLSSGTKRKCITLDEMGEYLPKAYIAIEDERFYDHFGVDLKRTTAATLTYILHAGQSDFGGSTITQQVVKNITEDKEDSANRKVKEMAKAIQVEHYLNKDQILELYLNIIFIGGNDNNGVELGAKYYFDKSAKDLSIAECAYMAGINHAPNAYKPFAEDPEGKNKEKINNRTKTVLGKMHELKYINDEQYNTAIAEVDAGLHFVKGDTSPTTIVSYQTEAALDQIIKQIMVEKNVNKQMAEMILYSGGYNIYTTQRTNLQEIVENELSQPKYLLYNHGQESMATFVMIDHHTGEVVACGAGVNDDKIKTTIGNFNYPTSLMKQTGSSMKPISVIAPGLESGVITASTVFYDGETTFGKYKPKNYYAGYKGPMTMRQAIAISANIPNIKALARIGVDESMRFCESVGITGLGQEGLALALGGLTHGTTTLKMAGAYSAIANDGVYVEPTFYSRVEDSAGNIYIQCKSLEERSHVVMSPQNAYIEKTILQSVVRPGGTATYCALPNVDVGAKTGTTNSDYDRWLCGFTPFYTAACWFGYEKNAVVYYSGNPAGLIWSSIMASVHAGAEGYFEEPEGIVRVNVCSTTGLAATGLCGSVYTEVFREGTVPGPCTGHGSALICNETGLLAGEGCTDVSYVYYPRVLEQEQNAPWYTVGIGAASVPSERCPGGHTPEVVETPVEPDPVVETPVVIEEPVVETPPASEPPPQPTVQETPPADNPPAQQTTTPPAQTPKNETPANTEITIPTPEHQDPTP